MERRGLIPTPPAMRRREWEPDIKGIKGIGQDFSIVLIILNYHRSR